MPDDQSKLNEHETNLITRFVACVFLLWLLTPLLIILGFMAFDAQSLELTPGTFGDLYGSVNALFAGLAFVGLIWTIILQLRTMRMQRSEIKIQQDMLNAQLEEQREASKSMQAQANAQLKMIESINALNNATSIQARISAEIAILQSLNEKLSNSSHSPDHMLNSITQNKIRDQEYLIRNLSSTLVRPDPPSPSEDGDSNNQPHPEHP